MGERANGRKGDRISPPFTHSPIHSLSVLSLFICAICVLSAISGCRRQESKVITLRMMVWGSAADERKWNDKLRDFYKAHPNVYVRLEYVVNERHLQKLLIATAGSKAPDASVISSIWFVPAASKGLLEDLGPYVARDKDFDLSDFYPQAVNGYGKYKGKLYAIPAGIDLYAIFYNKTMFDKYHVPYPDETWDWNKYLWAAKQLTRDTNGDGKIDQWGTTQNTWQSYVWASGGDILSKDNTRCLLDQPAASDPFHLEQAVWELIDNALRATERTAPLRPEVEVSACQCERGLVIAVRDNGCGVPRELRTKIFDPFFSTYPDRAGLGLTLAAALAADLGGRVELRDAVEAGSVFEICLPMRE
jgi:anti-sigma regulatory factor (Ser/Thr protein kinase)